MAEDTESDYVTRKVNKILESRVDNNKDTLDALNDISSFFTENTLKTRRNLRSQIEKRSLLINEDFLGAFRSVKESLDSICSDIDAMGVSMKTMKTTLKNSQDQTHDLILQTNQLQEESKKLQLQQKIAGAFLSRFQLSVEEHHIMYGATRDVPITQEFFTVLDRVQSIHSECRILMQSGYQTAALDIMEEMTLHQEAALERLYRWTQAHCRNVDANEIGSLVVQAMSRLQDRPILFKYIIDEYATARRSVLVRNFIDALITGGPNGNPKPIEHHTHEPKRYIGDMFAWLHQAIPTEKENLLLLLKACEKNDLTEQVQQALANISEGVCHPLKVRVETTLNLEKDTIVLYAIANLIRFYHKIINNVVKGGTLEQCITDLQHLSEQTYLNTLSALVRNQLQGPMGTQMGLEPPKSDLSPPQSVERLLSILKEVLSVASMVEGRQSDIQKIVSCVIDPLLHSVTESASHLPTVDMAVYMLNSLYMMQSTLASYEYIDERMERLQAQCDAQIDTLTSEQASSLVANLNLGPIYTLLQSSTGKIDANMLTNFMVKLNSFVDMPDMLLLPQVNLLQCGTHRSAVQRKSFDVIVAIYKQLYDKVNDPESGIEVSKEIFTKTPAEVAELLRL